MNWGECSVHGEYKVPGGKLVVVDLDVEDGRIAHFALAGDFFLEPDDALAAINAAVNGLPETVSAGEVAQAITRALPEGTQMLGFSADAVGIAVRRAMTRATQFGDYEWTIIHDPAVPPRTHLALDEVLTNEVGAGRRGPTLRFWEWDTPAVVIGSFQSYKNEVDPENAEKYGFDVVRRISGGGAMFMDAGSIITYSMSVPGDLVRGMSFQESYAYLDSWVIQALQSIGIDAYYQPLNDIASTKGKIGGAAQKRLGSGAVLHHATMAYDMDGEKMVQVLRIGREKMSDKGTTSAAKRVDPMRSQTGMERAEIIERLKSTFRALYGGVEGHVTANELAEAEALVASKFATEAWLHRVP